MAELRSTFLSLGGRFFLRAFSDRGRFCELVGAVPAACAATMAGLIRGFRVDVPDEIQKNDEGIVYRNILDITLEKTVTK